jgi:hypothetical protein
MKKKLSSETLNFIENIVVRYGLEKNLIEGDPALEKKLQLAESPEERRVTKFLQSQKIKECFALKKPVEEMSASVAIAKLTEKLINKEIAFDDFGGLLKSALENLNIDSKTIGEVAKIIENDKNVIEDLAKDDAEDYPEEEIPSPEQKRGIPGGINQELL